MKEKTLFIVVFIVFHFFSLSFAFEDEVLNENVHNEWDKRCSSKVEFIEGDSCVNICKGIYFDAFKNKCDEIYKVDCCEVEAPFESLDNCKSICEQVDPCLEKAQFEGPCLKKCLAIEFNSETVECEEVEKECCSMESPFSTLEYCQIKCGSN